MKRNLLIEGESVTADISSALTTDIDRLKTEWADALERERYARQAIVNLAAQIDELSVCIADARLRAAAPIPIATGLKGITEHSRQKRIAIDEVESLQEARQELLKELSRLESEFRGFQLEKSGIREGMFRIFFNDLLKKHKPLFARIAALGVQIGLTENMIAFELFNGCNDNLTDLVNELGI